MRAQRIVGRCIVAALLVTAAHGCAVPAGDPVSRSADAPTDHAAGGPPGLRIELRSDESGAVTSVDVVGLSPDELAALANLDSDGRAAVISVYLAGGDAADVPAVLGDVSASGEALRFTPRFPLGRNLRYRVVIARGRPSAHENAPPAAVSLEFATSPLAQGVATTVEHIYPSAERLPENQLKFYVHFSQPMGRGDAYRHLHLLDADRQELEAVFLELGQELWDPQMRRFTLLLDPGRVKRGLKPREELGPVLQAGQDYTLVIDRNWPDANGRPLAESSRKTFHVVEPDETPIDPATWGVDAPKAGTRDPLVVRFPEPLDRSLTRVLRVTTADGTEVEGAIEIRDGETRWQFAPQAPWHAGGYQLVADTALEDLAGNAIGRAFDIDTFGPVSQRIETESVAIPFSIEPTGRD